jgi:hypothetical protein
LGELVAESNKIKNENIAFKKKIDQYKSLNNDNKKLLVNKAQTFNEEGGELQTLKNQVNILEERVTSLIAENSSLKVEVNKCSDYNLEKLEDMTS